MARYFVSNLRSEYGEPDRLNVNAKKLRRMGLYKYNPLLFCVSPAQLESKNWLKAFKMADRTRLELATSGVTGRHSNQLNYRSAACTLYLINSVATFPT